MIKKRKRGVYTFCGCVFGVIALDNRKWDEEIETSQEIQPDIDQLLEFWLREENTVVDAQPEMPAQDSTPLDIQHEMPMQESAPEGKYRKQSAADWQGSILMYLHDLSFLLAGLVLVFLLLLRVVVVSGTSMNATLLDGDYLLLLSSTFYHDPQHGDIIVASKESFDNGAPIVKRVIATEGQWVNIDFERGVVYVGDSRDTMEPLDEPYTLTPTTVKEGTTFPLRVDEGHLFVLGDNRNGSKDSRHPEIGLIDKREVLGKVFFLFFPGTNYGQEKQDFGRIGVVD